MAALVICGGTPSLTLGLNLPTTSIFLGATFFHAVLSMIARLVLGMGLPTTANYIARSTIIAPALVVGAQPLAAHLFVFYSASWRTSPPVHLAPTGAGIAGADPTRRIQANTMALVAYLLPYTFVHPRDLAPGRHRGIPRHSGGGLVLGMLGLASAGQGGWLGGGTPGGLALGGGLGPIRWSKWDHPWGWRVFCS